jgi:lipopolysaccharide export system ATP-binding protein
MAQALFLPGMSVTISTKNLVKKYGSRTVVDHVSLEVNQGEIVGLLGPNGAGKTTSFYQVVGLIKPDEGKVFLNDQDITSLPMYKRAQMGIGYLPQEASIFRKLSVEDNIAAILEMTKLSKQEQRDKLESLLNEFRLQHVRKSNGDVLSGGERRRTEIARALSVDPKFILLDEPFAGIDPIAVEDIQAIVAKLKFKNIGILITDHNVTETLSICDRAYLLIEGKIFKHGTAEELAVDDEVKRLYLGRNFELKRKDYLHEEARGEREASFDSLRISVQSSIYLIDQINEAAKAWDRATPPRNKYDSISVDRSTDRSDDIGISDLHKFLFELRNSLETFAKDKKDNEILNRLPQLIVSAYQLEDIDLRNTVKGDLSTILLFLNAYTNN